MSSTTTITETCGCGSTFEITTGYSDSARRAVDEWRRDHRHAESVGICGDKAPIVTPEGSDLPPLFCDLKAGHPGAHSDGTDHWFVAEEASA